MCHKAQALALESSYPPAQKFALYRIATVVNDMYDMRWFMRNGDLADQIGVQRTTISNWMKDFVEDGWLEVLHENNGGRSRPTEYRWIKESVDSADTLGQESVDSADTLDEGGVSTQPTGRVDSADSLDAKVSTQSTRIEYNNINNIRDSITIAPSARKFDDDVAEAEIVKAAPTGGSRADDVLSEEFFERQSPGRRIDLHWEAMCQALGIDSSNVSEVMRGKINKSLKIIRDVGGTPEDIILRAGVYRHKFPKAPVTPNAISNNWEIIDPALMEPSGVQNDPVLRALHEWAQADENS